MHSEIVWRQTISEVFITVLIKRFVCSDFPCSTSYELPTVRTSSSSPVFSAQEQGKDVELWKRSAKYESLKASHEELMESHEKLRVAHEETKKTIDSMCTEFGRLIHMFSDLKNTLDTTIEEVSTTSLTEFQVAIDETKARVQELECREEYRPLRYRLSNGDWSKWEKRVKE